MQKCLDPHEFHVSLILYYSFKYYKCNYLFWVGFCRMTILVLFAWLKLNVIVLHAWMLNLNYLGINFFLLGVLISSHSYFSMQTAHTQYYFISLIKTNLKSLGFLFETIRVLQNMCFQLHIYISILKFNCL